MIISGSLLNADQANLVSCVHLAEKGGIDEIHFDVTNGIYVRNISFGPQTVADVQKIASVPVDIHLELDNTLDMIDLYGPLHPGCITVQADSTPHPLMTFRKIHSFGARVGFALNPSISPSQYEYCLPYMDELLIMSVEPGFGGQRFAEHTFKKIEEAQCLMKKLGIRIPIGVDGGINVDLALRLAKAGVSKLVIGSAIFAEKNITENVSAIRAILKGF